MKNVFLSAFALRNTVEMIVPYKDKFNNSINPQNEIEKLSKIASRKLGGLRLSNEVGFYINNDGKLIRERTRVLKASFSDNQEQVVNEIINKFIFLAATKLNQESAAVVLNGCLYLIPLDEFVKDASRNRNLVLPDNRTFPTSISNSTNNISSSRKRVI